MPSINLTGRRKKRVTTIAKRGYQHIYQDTRWKALQKQKRMHNPVCEHCAENDLTEPTEEVHHVIPFSWGANPEEVEALAFDFDNLKALCIPCHKAEHKRLELTVKHFKPQSDDKKSSTAA